MSVGAQMVIVLKAFVEHCVSLVLGHPFEFSWLDVSQTNVFHCSSPPMISDVGSLAHGAGPQGPVRPVAADDDARGHCLRTDEREFAWRGSLREETFPSA